MEHSLYISRVRNLKYYDSKFSRIYFGNEFCQRLIPSMRELKRVLDFVSANNLDFTFVTPYVTNEGLRILEPLFEKIAEERSGSEVVFNDWGTLQILNKMYSGLEPVMGRLLNKMKRGPRIINFLKILPESAIEYLKGSSIPMYCDFLLNNRVKRVELDNLLQGISLDLKFGISASLYTPYAYITTSRLCLAISCNVHGKEDEVGIFPCKQECQKYTFYMVNEVMPVPLIRKGNTVFFKNEKMPNNMEKIGINRIVFEPEIPM